LFFEDLFLYREPVNQWLQVTLDGGRTYCTGLLAGVLDGPPDKPLTAKESAGNNSIDPLPFVCKRQSAIALGDPAWGNRYCLFCSPR
jgi:hypothetical protein